MIPDHVYAALWGTVELDRDGHARYGGCAWRGQVEIMIQAEMIGREFHGTGYIFEVRDYMQIMQTTHQPNPTWICRSRRQNVHLEASSRHHQRRSSMPDCLTRCGIYSSSSSPPSSSPPFSAALAFFLLTRPGRPPPNGEVRAKSMCFWESRRTMKEGTLTICLPTLSQRVSHIPPSNKWPMNAHRICRWRMRTRAWWMDLARPSL